MTFVKTVIVEKTMNILLKTGGSRKEHNLKEKQIVEDVVSTAYITLTKERRRL